MNQDIFFQAIVFGGIYTVGFFIVYLFGRKKSPLLAIQFTVSSWLGLMLFVLLGNGPESGLFFVILILASLFIFRKKADDTTTIFQQFFSDNDIYKATVVPEQVAKLLGSHYYSCAEGTLTSRAGQEICFNWWQGMTSSMSKSGNAYITTFTHYLAISFAPNVVSEAFKQFARTKPDTSGLSFWQKFRRFFVLDTQTPIRIAETEDGSFVIVWQTYSDLQHYAYYLNWLQANLFGKETIAQVETNTTATLSPESTTPPVIPSSRQPHEQALGQAPNVYAHSHR